MFVLVFKYLLPKKYRGLTFFPFIILRNQSDKKDVVLLNHERIHIRQQVEMLLVFFYIWYIFEFLIRYFQYKDWGKAYENISLEREAYAKENDSTYLKKRAFWSFLNYL